MALVCQADPPGAYPHQVLLQGGQADQQVPLARSLGLGQEAAQGLAQELGITPASGLKEGGVKTSLATSIQQYEIVN